MDARSGSLPWDWVQFQGAGRDFDVARYEAAKWAILDACAWSMMGRRHEVSMSPMLHQLSAPVRERLQAFGLTAPAGFDRHRDAGAWLMTAFERGCDGLTHLERAMLTKELYRARVSVAKVYLPDEDAKETLLNDMRAWVRLESSTSFVVPSLFGLAVQLHQHPDSELEQELELVAKAWCQSLHVSSRNFEELSFLRSEGGESFVVRLMSILQTGLGSLVINTQPESGPSAGPPPH